MEHGSHTDHTGHAGHGVGPEAPQGLQVAARGYRFEPAIQIVDAGTVELRFVILGPDGEPLVAFEERHDKQLHLIVVSRDTSVFHHVHPSMDSAGSWTVQLALTPGVWRVLADFVPQGAPDGLTLGADLFVPGGFHPRPLPELRRAWTGGDYTVTLEGDLVAAQAGELQAVVTWNGVPVTDLQPYLAAYGHLVALRAGDLAYMHIHPEGSPSDPQTPAGPRIRFHAVAPSVGIYRLFLDFRHQDTVRTADFTLVATGGTTGAVTGGASAHHHQQR